VHDRLKVGVLHLNIKHGAVAENRYSLIAQAERAAFMGARIIVAPELAISGYSFDGREDVAPYMEKVSGKTVTVLSRLARRFGVYLCFGLGEEEKETGIFYNSAVVIGPDGRLVAHHRKHVAERRWSCPGQPSPASIFETPWGKVGLLICADSYYGLLPRSMALQEADLLLVCANWPLAGLDPREIWRARMLENGIGVIAANRTGLDKRMDCRNAPSYGLTPDGTVLLDATAEDSAIHFIEYPLDGRRFPSRFRKERMTRRRPHDYNAIALDSSGLDDFSGMWGLPAAGPIAIKCVVPPSGSHSLLDLLKKMAATLNGVHGIILLPPGVDSPPLSKLVPLTGKKALAIMMETRSSEGYIMPVLISEGRASFLSPEANSMMADFGPARIALVRKEALSHPEQVVALSKSGCDILVSQTETLDDDTRLVLGVKSLERVVIAVAAPDGATICEPPEGHERWRETMIGEPGVCEAVVDTARTRKKRFLDRVDLGVLLRR